MTGKGKVSAYAFGTVNRIFYGYISYMQTLYGDDAEDGREQDDAAETGYVGL